jgi:glycosyltransferase involved in cell wall biosynthesis
MKADAGRDIVFVSLEKWDEIWRRNQFLCDELATRFPEHKILFIEPPRNASHHLRKLDFSQLREPAISALPEFPNITLLRPLKLWPNSIPWGRKLNDSLALHQIRRAIARCKMHSPLLWINAHESAHLARRIGECGLVYDITDDWTQFGSPAVRALAKQLDDFLTARADLTIVCSQALYESRKALCRRILLLPNGVHVEHYQNLSAKSDTAQKYSHPVWGYTGTLHPERVDADLILTLARQYPHGSVVLVGPQHFDAATVEKLQSFSNIHLVGAVPYAELPRYMAAFDVCIVPHIESSFTESLNPIKLWEYLACGKPIAATNVAGFRDYRALCHIGSDTEGFLCACADALAELGDDARARQRQDIAAQHSWRSRVDELLVTLDGLSL